MINKLFLINQSIFGIDILEYIDPTQIVLNTIKYLTTIALTVIAFYILTKVFIIVNHYLAKGYLVKVSDKRKETILTLLDNLIKYIMGITGTFAVLIAFGFDKTTLIASAGAASIIIGIAAKELITDFINGFFTVVEGYYDVGDYIVVNEYTGIVEKLGIKSTVLRTDKGEEITIPNSLIEEIINYNRGEHHLFLAISTSYEVSVDQAQNVIENKLIPNIIENSSATAASYLGVKCLNTSSVDHSLKVTCLPNDRFQVERDVYKQTKIIFDQNEIEIPYTKISLINDN